MNPEDNLEEFGYLTAHDIEYWKDTTDSIIKMGKPVVASFGGTALGDIALVPGLNLRHPKGIRGIDEWYMSTLTRESFIIEIFERQTDIAIDNLKMLNDAVGDKVDVAFICGTDFGTQKSTFCSPESFDRIWKPFYRKVNDWIHTILHLY